MRRILFAIRVAIVLIVPPTTVRDGLDRSGWKTPRQYRHRLTIDIASFLLDQPVTTMTTKTTTARGAAADPSPGKYSVT
ncbi:MAG: hypothetical protein P9L99_21720 [Candidatus Lernaella stagnicola]|nr:hypothetical protein [Candidatus Lernaella stagnicola]